MQALKLLVIFMAVLILAGMGLLAYGLVTRVAEGDGGGGFAAVDVPLPDGCSIAETAVAENRLILRFEGLAERGCQQVVVVDMTTGKVLGQVRGVPGAP
ncbi:hypothetical protein HBA54_17860 [Pelagibius litoralis]|uniref:Uncharacterized protein n=1 Tax=Pelagibius litoralis TaxID=374515 RepID=A0A967EZX0_9PROT|nr:hypothetical protein [Pelagibius litoralis]NIA70465.1 hypothetical protein [Pelagibius litoralis]